MIKPADSGTRSGRWRENVTRATGRIQGEMLGLGLGLGLGVRIGASTVRRGCDPPGVKTTDY